MADEISIAEIDEFLASPIVMWFASCLGGSVRHQLTYEELVDGVLIYDVFLQMDIDGHSNDVSASLNNADKHLANLQTVMRHIRQFYEDYLGEVILHEPDFRLIVQEPRSNVREVELLLVLLLGCAVKCRNNEYFVEGIKSLDGYTKEVIAGYIKKVMCFPDLVLSKEMLLVQPTDDEKKFACHEQVVHKTIQEFRRINRERNELLEQLRSTVSIHNDAHGCEKELKEWKCEAIALNDQIDEYKRKVAAMESENKRLAAEAKSHRDTLEFVSEKIQHTERLEHDLSRYREKLKQVSSYKQRLDELEYANRSLKERNEELKGKLGAQRAEAKRKMREMAMEIDKLQERCNELEMQNEASCEQNSRLCEENADLERRMKLSTSLNFTLDDSLVAEVDDDAVCDISLCEQLSQSTHSHALKLELESRRLETLKENSLLEVRDLDKEKKRLELANEELRAKVGRLEESLEMANEEKMQLAKKVGGGELESMMAVLEFEKNDAEVKSSPYARKSTQDFGYLMYEYRKEKSRADDLTQRYGECQEELRARSAQLVKLGDKYDLLVELKNRAESDNKRLMRQMSAMLSENRAFVTKTLERQRQFHDNERQKDETLNNLNRAKAKLEDKVMDQYRSMTIRRDAKKRSAAVSAVKNTFVKVRRAGSEFFGVSRWSSAEDTDFRCGMSKTLDGSARTNGLRLVRTPRNRKSGDFLEGFSPENFSFDSKEGES